MGRSRLAVSFGARLDLDIVVGDEAPAATDALVVAQDVNLIMGDVEPVVAADGGEDSLAAAAGAARFQPRALGSLVVGPERAGAPLLLQAVVYDFEHTPPASEPHVFLALLAAFEEANRRGLATLAVRPVGTAHAGIDPAALLRVLAQLCYSSAELGTSLRHVHLLLDAPGQMARYEALLQQMIGPRARRP